MVRAASLRLLRHFFKANSCRPVKLFMNLNGFSLLWELALDPSDWTSVRLLALDTLICAMDRTEVALLCLGFGPGRDLVTSPTTDDVSFYQVITINIIVIIVT